MCWFIAGTLPKAASVPAVNSIVAPEGGRWRLVSDASVHARALRGFDFFDLTGGCGCGTALGSARCEKNRRDVLPRAAARWSETKKRRWLEQRFVLITNDNAAVHGGAVAWHQYMKRIAEAVPFGPVGVMLYWADRETILRVQDPVAIDNFRPAEFLRMEENTLYQFVAKGSSC